MPGEEHRPEAGSQTGLNSSERRPTQRRERGGHHAGPAASQTHPAVRRLRQRKDHVRRAGNVSGQHEESRTVARGARTSSLQTHLCFQFPG